MNRANSKKCLYLHIGYNKAGSSSIQSFFDINRDKLEEIGILYPKTGIFSNAHYKISGALGFGVTPEIDKENYTVQSLLKNLKNEIENSKATKILLSSEYFVIAKDTNKLRNFFNDYDVRIIIYLRRHDEWYESLYNQAVKSVKEPRWEKGIKNYINHVITKQPLPTEYGKLLETWENTFSANNVLIRPFEQEQFYKGDLILDILNCMGADSVDIGGMKSNRLNEALDTRVLSVIDDIKRSDLSDNQKNGLSKRLNAIYFSKLEQKKIYNLSQNDRQAIINQHAPSYNYIAQKKLGKNYLFQNMIAKQGDTLTDTSSEHYLKIILKLFNMLDKTKNNIAQHNN